MVWERVRAINGLFACFESKSVRLQGPFYLSTTIFDYQYVGYTVLFTFRCKSYELGPLIEKILGKSTERRIEIDAEMMKQAFSNSNNLLTAVNLSLQDASDMLQVTLFVWIPLRKAQKKF